MLPYNQESAHFGDSGATAMDGNNLANRAAQIVTKVGPIVAAEAHPVRRARLIARAAATITGGRAIIWQLDAATGILRALAHLDGVTLPQSLDNSSGIFAMPQLSPLRTGEGVAGHVAITGNTLIVNTWADEQRVPAEALTHTAERLGYIPSALCALALIESGTVVGVLEVTRMTPGAVFDDPLLEQLRALGALAALALGVEQRQQEVRNEHALVIQRQEDERRRLARDLHDGPIQVIANAAMTLEHIDAMVTSNPTHARLEIRRLYDRFVKTARDLRQMIFDLRPVTLETEGLEIALEDLIESYAQASPRIVLQYDVARRLPADIESTIFLVVREALQNVLKHACATHCLIAIRQTAEYISASVRDNGVGFDPETVLASYPHGRSWGLLNMHERVRPHSKQFSIQSHPGQGTTVQLAIPWPR